ncbi:hypothetical protein Pfo_024395 [Paulownia fortunei]|nr:hypothetical protein Pfo_024395 [Paulownia fortunei]
MESLSENEWLRRLNQSSPFALVSFNIYAFWPLLFLFHFLGYLAWSSFWQTLGLISEVDEYARMLVTGNWMMSAGRL